MELKDRVVMVTGGARRLGRAVALTLAGRGADVVIHYGQSREEAEALAVEIRSLGRRVLIVQAELADVTEIEAMFARVEETLGRLDVLVNSAANFLRVSLEELTEESWDRSLDVNLKGTVFCAREAARMMRQRGEGKIINFADWAALRPYPGFLPYMISKGGVVTLTRALAIELAPAIQVNAIAPGHVLPPDGASAEVMERLASRVPLKRLGTPEDIAKAVLYLIEGGDYVTGQILCVDGGRLVGCETPDY